MELFQASSARREKCFLSLSKSGQACLQDFTKSEWGCVLMQVVLSGEAQHSVTSAASAPSAQNGFPSLSESSAAGNSAALNGIQAASAHPLQLYYEYLSYLFRRPPLPQGQEEMEIGYRDYLQVSSPQALASDTSKTAANVISIPCITQEAQSQHATHSLNLSAMCSGQSC